MVDVLWECIQCPHFTIKFKAFYNIIMSSNLKKDHMIYLQSKNNCVFLHTLPNNFIKFQNKLLCINLFFFKHGL